MIIIRKIIDNSVFILEQISHNSIKYIFIHTVGHTKSRKLYVYLMSDYFEAKAMA